MSNFTKIFSVGAQLFRANRETDINVIIACRNFSSAPENGKYDTLNIT